jgi:hypothetical protein
MDDTHPTRPTRTSKPTAIGWALDSLMSRRTTSDRGRTMDVSNQTVIGQPSPVKKKGKQTHYRVTHPKFNVSDSCCHAYFYINIYSIVM